MRDDNAPAIGNTDVPVHVYSFGPFALHSEIELAELAGDAESARWVVTVRRGQVPETLAGGERYGAACEVSAREFLLRVPGLAGFYACDGAEVWVDEAPEAIATDLSAYLLGAVFGALCHQKGLLPLHGSSVRGPGGVVAFLAESGGGKSTLAAWLSRRGYAVVSDDICLLEEQAGAMQVVPVARWLKLWRESLERLGEEADQRQRTFSREDKYRLMLQAAGTARLPLRHVVLLERSTNDSGPVRLVKMTTGEAIARMMRMIYVGYVTELTGMQARAFVQCARALEAAQAWRLCGPWGWESMAETVELVERELLRATPADG